jgi:uncharacterized membrane protein (UPF0127 family)
MEQKKKTIIMVVGILLWICAAWAVMVFFQHLAKKSTENSQNPQQQKVSHTLEINNKIINLEIADTNETREDGLSDRESLASTTGMLFIFPVSDKWAFWMQDTLIPLDMIWMDENYKVVYIKANVQPETFPESFAPLTPARFVLEVNAGFAAENHISVGSVLKIQ